MPHIGQRVHLMRQQLEYSDRYFIGFDLSRFSTPSGP